MSEPTAPGFLPEIRVIVATLLIGIAVILVLWVTRASETVIAGAVIRVILLTLALDNLRLALAAYRFHQDARGLRGFVAGLAMLGGALAFGAGGESVRAAMGTWADIPFRVMTGIGVTMFIGGLIFSRIAWRIPMVPR